MPSLHEMFAAPRESEITQITGSLTAASQTIPVANINAMWPAPNLATIFDKISGTTETVYYGGMSANSLTGVIRAWQGRTEARSWAVGTDITNGVSSYLQDTIKTNTGILQGAVESLESRVDDKLDKISTTGGRRAYVINPDGTQDTEIIVSNTPSAYSIPERNERGTFAVGEPVEGDEPIPKWYFEAHSGDGVVNIYNIDDIDGAVTNGTSLQFNQSIVSKISAGSMVTGTVRFSDLPQDMMQAEIIMFVSTGNQLQHKSFLFSQDVEPGLWNATGYFSNAIDWRATGGSDIDPALFLKWEYVGEPSGVAPLDADSKVPAANLPGALGGNVINYVDKILNVDPDTATLRIYHSGDPSPLEGLDDEILLAFIIVALVSETQRGSDLNWGPEKMQALCQAFYEARITGIDISGTLGGQHLMANIENISASYDEADMTANEIVADYTMPTLGRNLQSNTAHMRAYIVADEQEPSGYRSLADIVFGGGTFQSRWTATGLDINVQPGAKVDLFQSMLQTGPYLTERGLQGMSFNTDFSTGIVKFPGVQEFIPYDLDIRIGGAAGSSGIHAFKINLVRVQDGSIARSYKSLYVDTNILANESISGLSYTDGINDPYILYGMQFELENSAAGDELTITDIDITIQGTRS